MLILYNPVSSAGRKPILPMSLLALGALLEGEEAYAIVDGNLVADPLAELDARIRETGADLLGMTVMPGPQLAQATELSKALKARHGADLWTHSDAPPGSGLGASSTLMVALLAVLREWLKLDLSPYDMAELAYRVERIDLKLAGGRQDQYAASFGGFNYIEFDKAGTVVTPLRLRRDTLEELEYRLLLCYMGQTRQSARIIERQTKSYTSGRKDTVDALSALKLQTAEMKRALLLGHVDGFGELLHQAWLHKKKLAEGISTPHVDEMYKVARKEGALGGKMTGAGGGGYFLFLTRFDRRHRVAAALEKLGGQVVPFQFEARGVQSWPVARER